MKGRIRASLAQTGEDLGLVLRRALSGGVARRIELQIERRAAGRMADAPVRDGGSGTLDDGGSVGRSGGASVGKAGSDIQQSEGVP
ncbi:hypothetical protein [Ciceribacter selenitireducens]|uniref:hypothetical protein n=1 Tax=Ciceribacter selenitireducens TaxID=448181 RepID=UPI000E1FD2EB|nr:hypothetical protein [Ciceribacter selenitireducens]